METSKRIASSTETVLRTEPLISAGVSVLTSLRDRSTWRTLLWLRFLTSAFCGTLGEPGNSGLILGASTGLEVGDIFACFEKRWRSGGIRVGVMAVDGFEFGTIPAD